MVLVVALFTLSSANGAPRGPREQGNVIGSTRGGNGPIGGGEEVYGMLCIFGAVDSFHLTVDVCSLVNLYVHSSRSLHSTLTLTKRWFRVNTDPFLCSWCTKELH